MNNDLNSVHPVTPEQLKRKAWARPGFGCGLLVLFSPLLALAFYFGSYLLLDLLTPDSPRVSDLQLAGKYTCDVAACQTYQVNLMQEGKGALMHHNIKACDVLWKRSNHMELEFRCEKPLPERLISVDAYAEDGKKVYNFGVPLNTYKKETGTSVYFCVMFTVDEHEKNCFKREIDLPENHSR
ncbi:hypothetical protein [Deinococcus cellulosilyticus]|uniref:Uncharacterized protein n=1 Tax=Deinococcus cellulosilyticus (strain DSM 18568 / NBRC 106333 / KACC 11606 / 5516J-15) TaxID=1223518 RepID=A0A511MY75_DEIC1|nr:hypothetical protein [Deinococcus cellulosilyticus]GEM45540.1 hypothetical protein DC3_11750 [Deinococcus cellulosilyticus NBRC 106333 = KACC 11606]